MSLHCLSMTVSIVLRKLLEVEVGGLADRRTHNFIKLPVLQAPVSFELPMYMFLLLHGPIGTWLYGALILDTLEHQMTEIHTTRRESWLGLGTRFQMLGSPICGCGSRGGFILTLRKA